MAQIQQEILNVIFTKVIDSQTPPTFVSAATVKSRLETANIAAFLFSTNTVVDVINVANLTLNSVSMAVTSIFGTGSIATIAFSTQDAPPFSSGQPVQIMNTTPDPLNGIHTVLTCSNSEVTIASSTIPEYSLGNSLPITGVSGNGTVASLTYATQPSAPFLIGDKIIVSGVTPIGYNTVFANSPIATVLTANTTTVTFASTVTGSDNFVIGAGIVSEYISSYVAGTGTISEVYQ